MEEGRKTWLLNWGGVAMDAGENLRLSKTTSKVPLGLRLRPLDAGLCLCILGFNPLLDSRQR
uniref:Uncharacterized protein n=1 Tax=Peronospora matthiolae TaxID=2874970 RepID=A0AAV1TBB9_9STRA